MNLERGIESWFRGLHFGARMEVTAKALVDHALTRPEVDSEQLAFFGFSWGGHIALKGARFDLRIRALITNPLCLWCNWRRVSSTRGW